MYKTKILESSKTGIKAVEYDLRRRGYNALVICQVTDMHYGARSVSRSVVESYRDFILAGENRFMVWTGDMINAATPYSPGHPHDDHFGPKDQIEEFCDIWRIGDAHKRVLGYVGGNHELRAVAQYADLGPEISDRLGIHYSADYQEIRVRFNSHYNKRSRGPFSILQHHQGIGGKRASFGEMMKERPDNDVYLTGHYHSAATERVTRKRRDQNGDAFIEIAYGMRGSSFMDQYTPYAAAKGHRLNKLQMPSIVLPKQGDAFCCDNYDMAFAIDAGCSKPAHALRAKLGE